MNAAELAIATLVRNRLRTMGHDIAQLVVESVSVDPTRGVVFIYGEHGCPIDYIEDPEFAQTISRMEYASLQTKPDPS